MLVGLLEKHATSETQTSVNALSVRLPTLAFCDIEAMAQHSGISRNKVVCELIEFALSEVWNSLDEENERAINAIRYTMYKKLTGEPLPQAEPGEV